MELNNLQLVNYDSRYQECFFTLDSTFDEVSKLDGETLTVTSDGELVAMFGGYHLTSIERRGNFLYASFMRNLEPNTEQVIKELEANQQLSTADLQTQIDIQGDTLAALIELQLGA